ncbi:chemotaxis protein CheA, partial [Methylobacterium sp. WL18]|uniref:Hpt domain-containing protein n=1 Tax=Methylobacterium sp. WL18 TaxID=2603897 RepID=UPI0011DB8C3F
MTDHDPRAVFLAEANELLDRLETTLLDLGDRPGDTALVDTAFRALHTIKGSGAMFGFDQVAAFTHDFETAFDLVRRGAVPISAELVNVSLSAKDYIRTLIEDPDATAPVIGEAILAELERLVGRAQAQPAQRAGAEGAAQEAAQKA